MKNFISTFENFLQKSNESDGEFDEYDPFKNVGHKEEEEIEHDTEEIGDISPEEDDSGDSSSE